MKKVIVLVGLVVMLSGLSYAAGPPVQPVPDVKGCWVSTFVMTQTGGSAQTPNGNPMVCNGCQPFFWNPGAKRTNQTFMRVNFQSGTQIKGTYYSWIGPINDPTGCYQPIAAQYYEYPFEGYVSGNLFQLHTGTANGPFREEQRYLNGILTKDSSGKRVIHGMGITTRDLVGIPFTAVTNSCQGSEVPPPIPAGAYAWTNIVYTFTMEPYSGSCDALPTPGAADVQMGNRCPWYGCPPGPNGPFCGSMCPPPTTPPSP